MPVSPGLQGRHEINVAQEHLPLQVCAQVHLRCACHQLGLRQRCGCVVLNRSSSDGFAALTRRTFISVHAAGSVNGFDLTPQHKLVRALYV